MIYDSDDDVPLTQIVLQRNTGVSTKDKDSEYDQGDESYEDNITGENTAIRQKKYSGMAEYLDDEDNVESKGKYVVAEFLLYASVICT